MFSDTLISNPLFPRAAVLGLFGAVSLALTVLYSRRGPMIYPVYAALLAALGLLTSRFANVPFGARFTAILLAFCIASAGLWFVAGQLATRARRRLVADELNPEPALPFRPSPAGYAARAGFLLGIGIVVCAGVAFVAV